MAKSAGPLKPKRIRFPSRSDSVHRTSAQQMDSSAVDGDVARGRTRSQRDVRLAGLGLGGRLQSNTDVAGHRVEVEPSGTDCRQSRPSMSLKPSAGRPSRLSQRPKCRRIPSSPATLHRAVISTMTEPDPDFARDGAVHFAQRHVARACADPAAIAVHPSNRDTARTGAAVKLRRVAERDVARAADDLERDRFRH